MVRTLALSLAALALVLFVTVPAPAKKDDTKSDTTEYTLVKTVANKITLKKDDKEQTLDVAADAKITCDGVVCKLADLRPGTKVRATITTKVKGPVTDTKVTKIETPTK